MLSERFLKCISFSFSRLFLSKFGVCCPSSLQESKHRKYPINTSSFVDFSRPRAKTICTSVHCIHAKSVYDKSLPSLMKKGGTEKEKHPSDILRKKNIFTSIKQNHRSQSWLQVNLRMFHHLIFFFFFSSFLIF